MRISRVVGIAVAAIALSLALDQWAWHSLGKNGVYDADFGRMLRVVGYLPLWLIAGVAIGLVTRELRRALLLGLVPTAGGLAAEVLKIVLRRERPALHDGHYYFRSFADQLFATRDIGLPSSHVLVAFSGAWLLCRMYPRGWPVWLLLAAGCAVTRVQARAHFLSDTVVAAVAAYAVVDFIWKRWGVTETANRPPLRPA